MKKNAYFLASFFSMATCFAQPKYPDTHCSTDTIYAHTYDKNTGVRISYKAFKCTQFSKFGIRVDVGFNASNYNRNTREWLGHPVGASVGLGLSYKRFNFGLRFKPATARPQTVLTFNGVELPMNAKLYPVKLEYEFSYSLPLPHQLAIEPYIAFTKNGFQVINENELGNKYAIPAVGGFTSGVALNKYFALNHFRSLAVFVKYGYGFTDFKKANNQLGRGYSDFSAGIAFKVPFRRHFLNRIN